MTTRTSCDRAMKLELELELEPELEPELDPELELELEQEPVFQSDRDSISLHHLTIETLQHM
jgi:hypothetical protein